MSDNLAHQLEKPVPRPSLGASLENPEMPPTVSNENLAEQFPEPLATQEQDINRKKHQARRAKGAMGQAATGTAMRAGGKGIEAGGKIAEKAGGAVGKAAGGAVGAGLGAGVGALGGAAMGVVGGPTGMLAGAKAGASTGARVGSRAGGAVGKAAGQLPGQAAKGAGRGAQASGIRRQRNAARSAMAEKTKASNIKEKAGESFKNATGIDASKGIGSINVKDQIKHKINTMVLTPLWLGMIFIETAPIAMIGLDIYLALSLLMPKAPMPQFGEDMVLGKILRTGGSKEFAKIIEILILAVVNVFVATMIFILIYVVYKFSTASIWDMAKGIWALRGGNIEEAISTALGL